MREFPLDSKYLKGPVLHNFLAKTLPKRKFCFRLTPWVHWVKWLKLWKKNAPRQWTKCPTMFHPFTHNNFQPRSSKSCAKFLCSLKKSLNSKRIASVSVSQPASWICPTFPDPGFRGPGPVESCGTACCICASAHLHCPHLPRRGGDEDPKTPFAGGRAMLQISKVTENRYTPTKTNMEPQKDGFQDPRSESKTFPCSGSMLVPQQKTPTQELLRPVWIPFVSLSKSTPNSWFPRVFCQALELLDMFLVLWTHLDLRTLRLPWKNERQTLLSCQLIFFRRQKVLLNSLQYTNHKKK